MKNIAMFLLLLVSAIGQAQKEISVEINFSSQHTLDLPPSPFTKENASEDIKKGTMKIVLLGGFNGFGDIDKYRKEEFERKYGITFEYLGCVIVYGQKDEDIQGYNEIIFEHLSSLFGQVVRDEYEDIWNSVVPAKQY